MTVLIGWAIKQNKNKLLIYFPLIPPDLNVLDGWALKKKKSYFGYLLAPSSSSSIFRFYPAIDWVINVKNRYSFLFSFFCFVFILLFVPSLSSFLVPPPRSPMIGSERGKLKELELFISHWTAFAPGYGNCRPGVKWYIKEMRLRVRLWLQSKWKR